ncbi:MAG: hypothetical protein C0412_21420 [Flavobacterium sp.]|nr:hypothetical protein [Flavobacterium sp.]
MEYTVKLNEQQVEVLKSILAQIEPMALIYTPSVKPKKLSKMEEMRQSMKEYRAHKSALKAERERKKKQ